MFKPCPSFSQTFSKYQTHISFKRNNANRCLDGKKKKNKPETNSIGFAWLIGNQDLGCSGSRGNLVELAYRANRKGECANPTTRLGQLNASVFWSMPLASQLARHHLSLSLSPSVYPSLLFFKPRWLGARSCSTRFVADSRNRSASLSVLSPPYPFSSFLSAHESAAN